MSNKNGVTVGGVFRTFAEIRDVASKASGVMTTQAFTNTTLALLDYIEAQAAEKAQAQRAAFMDCVYWATPESVRKSTLEQAPHVARERYPDPSHIDEAIAEHLAQDTGGKDSGQAQSRQCTECPSTESNPHSTSLCRDCQIKQLQAMLEDERQKLSVLAAEAKYPNGENAGKMIRGTWPKNDPRRGFVDGARWCFYELTGATMFSSERETAKDKAQEWSAAQRPMPTRADIEDAIENCITDDFYQSVNKELLLKRIMALFGTGGDND